MEEVTKQDEVEIDLKEIMSLILQNAAVIILAALCVGIFLYTNAKSKVSTFYVSTTKMYILSKNNLEDTLNGDAKVVSPILEDYKALLTSKEILEEVNQQLELDSSYERLASQIVVNIPEDGKIAQLTVTDTNPITSMKIANTLRDVTGQYIYNTMGIRLFDIVEEAMVGTPHTIDKAKRNAVLGGFAVAFLMMGVIAAKYLIDDSIKTPEEIENKLGLSVLATIPINEKQEPQKDNKWIRRIKGLRHSNKNKLPENTDTKIKPQGSEGENQ